MKYFYYIKAGQRLGPISKAEIMGLVGSDTLTLNDIIFDTRTSKWLAILEHPDFLRINSGKDSSVAAKEEMTISIAIAPTTGIVSKAPQMKSSAVDPKQPQLKWHFKSGLTTLGPVTTMDLLMMYMRKELNEGDLVKNDKEIEWRTVKKIFPAELLDQIRMLEPADDELTFPEGVIRFHQLIYASNKSAQYMVHGLSISATALEFVASSLLFAVGDEVVCNFHSSKGRYTTLVGVITSTADIPCKLDGFPLIRYSLKLNTQFGLSNL